jgi:hypothetical protein
MVKVKGVCVSVIDVDGVNFQDISLKIHISNTYNHSNIYKHTLELPDGPRQELG